MLPCLVPILFAFYLQDVLKFKCKIPAPKGFNHFYLPSNAIIRIKPRRYQYFKRQLKTPTRFGSLGIHPQGALNVLRWNYLWCFVCVVGVWQREIWTVIWNWMSNLYGVVPKLLTWIIIDELSFKILIHLDFNLLSFIQLSALVGQ